MDRTDALAALKTGTPRVRNEFEEASRQIRWFFIIVVVLAFPPDADHIFIVYAISLLAVLYNASRYTSMVLRSRFLSSPATVIVIDSLFICALVALVGSLSTPFSAFLFLMVVSSAYWYRLRGVLLVILLQLSLIYVATERQWFEAVYLNSLRDFLITISSFIAIGWLVERLTRSDKQERDEFRQIAEENEIERSRLKGLIDSLRTAIFVVDRSGSIILHNGAAVALTGKDHIVRGQKLTDVLPVYLRTDPDRKPVTVIQEGKEAQHRRDLSLAVGGQENLDLEMTITPVQLQDLRATNYVIACEDITHDLSLNEQRSEFISVASHELRTPIAIMEAALSTVLHDKEGLSKDNVGIIEQAHANSLLLSGIVKDLAMLAEAKNDNIPIQLENIDGGKLMRQIAEDFRRQADQKHLGLKLDVQEGLPPVLSTERHIREILQNYMTNAIKYSAEGALTLKVRSSKTGAVIFSVGDTGIGISPTDQKNLFNKFFRAEDYRTQHVGGTGLGLYLCKELAERLGGKVWCESTLNKGSTFFLEIPPFSGLRRDHSEVTQAHVTGLLEDL